jgi:hypothetical protein
MNRTTRASTWGAALATAVLAVGVSAPMPVASGEPSRAAAGGRSSTSAALTGGVVGGNVLSSRQLQGA